MAAYSLPVGASPSSLSPLRRGESFNDGLDRFACGNRKHVPSLDGLRSPFSDKVALPFLALSRKARARLAESDFDTSTKSHRQSPGLSGSQSLPTLPAIVSPDYPAASPIPTRPSLRNFKKDRSDNSVTAETPNAGSDATGTPSTAFDSPAWQQDFPPRFPMPSSERMSLSRATPRAPFPQCPLPSFSRGSRKERLDPLVITESPHADSDATTTPYSTATPSTALDSRAESPAFQSRLVSPNDAGTSGHTPSSRTDVATPSTSVSACSNQSHALRWRQGEEIGSGSYGHVYMAQCKSTGHIFAVKVSKHSREGEDKKVCETLEKELSICKNLRHRHIVACLGHEFVNRRLYIYLEYVPGKSLRHMVNEFGPLEPPLLVKATRGMLKGLNYLHKRNPPVAHRDLKGANVLIDLQFCVKLADFGCSKCDDMSKSFSKVGSIHWVAPEVLNDAGHGRKADIWSLGCVVIEIATAADPWGAGAFDNMMQAMYVIAASQRTPPIPDALSESARSFVSLCLQRSPAERASASQLLQHPCLQSESSASSCCFSRPSSVSRSTKECRGATSTKDSRGGEFTCQ